jgi:hypothetical protein
MITQQNVIDAFNRYPDVAHLKCYVTSAIFNRYQNTAFIFGHHGNQVLLHKFIFLDQIIMVRPAVRDEIKQYLRDNQKYYCQGMSCYDFNKTPVGIERIHMVQKPWAVLNGLNGNALYAPFTTNRNFSCLRRLDFDYVSIDQVIDAGLARSLLRDDNQDLEMFVYRENLNDLDNLKDIQLPISGLDKSLLHIPENLCHDPEGKEYIQHEIEQAKKTGEIPINSLVSIKNLHWLSSQA